VLLVGACLRLALPSPETIIVKDKFINIYEIKKSNFEDYIPVGGEVFPVNIFLITASSSGRVKTLSAADGEVVAAGAKLATLENPDFALDQTSRQAEISARFSEANTLLIGLNRSKSDRESQIADATYALHKAELELEKREQLREAGIVNDAFIKPYADEVEYRRDHLAQLKETQAQEDPVFAAQRRQIEATVAELTRNMREVQKGKDVLVIKAPAGGRLTDFTLKRGQSIKAGESVGEIDSLEGFKLKAQIDEHYAARLRPGLQATAQLANQSWKLVLDRVSRQVSGGLVAVELRFAEPEPSALHPGQTVAIRVLLDEATDAVTVPNGAWLSEGDGSSIFVLAADGVHAERRTIRIGRRNPEWVEILGGLQVGEKVLTATGLRQTKARHLIIGK
jgi:HlyD family secretion protein